MEDACSERATRERRNEVVSFHCENGKNLYKTSKKFSLNAKTILPVVVITCLLEYRWLLSCFLVNNYDERV